MQLNYGWDALYSRKDGKDRRAEGVNVNDIISASVAYDVSYGMKTDGEFVKAFRIDRRYGFDTHPLVDSIYSPIIPT